MRISRTARNKSQQEKLISLLLELRLQAGLRQVDIASRLHLPQSFVSKYESGERTLDLFELRLVCKSLGITFPEFIRLLEERLLEIDET